MLGENNEERFWDPRVEVDGTCEGMQRVKWVQPVDAFCSSQFDWKRARLGVLLEVLRGPAKLILMTNRARHITQI